MNASQTPAKAINIPVVNVDSGPVDMDTPTLPEDVWKEKRENLVQRALERDWAQVLKILTDLSTSRRFPDTRKALAQRIWVALKSDAPSIDVVTAIRELIMILSGKHELAPSFGALSYLLARRRQPDHPDAEFSVAMAQQLLHLICEGQGVASDEGFAQWVKDNRLEEPDYYLPKVMEGLEIMVMGDWWFDRDLLQEELEQANQTQG